jgi:integrase/recombinase XerD
MSTPKSLTTIEIEKVLAHIAQRAYAERNKLMLLFTVAAGLRVSEVASLTIGDVRNDDGTVRSEIYFASHRVKHGHARTIFINTRLQQELAAYLSTRTMLDADLPLFSTQRGVRCAFSSNTLTQYFYWMFRKAGVKGASSHSCRKTFLTSLASQGVSVFVLASLAGHKSITTTQRYITTNDDVKRRAVELV